MQGNGAIILDLTKAQTCESWRHNNTLVLYCHLCRMLSVLPATLFVLMLLAGAPAQVKHRLRATTLTMTRYDNDIT